MSLEPNAPMKAMTIADMQAAAPGNPTAARAAGGGCAAAYFIVLSNLNETGRTCGGARLYRFPAVAASEKSR
jgi:hypothetical protein